MKFEKIIKIILILATVITLALIINYIIKENNSAQAAVDAVTEMSESVREGMERLTDIILENENIEENKYLIGFEDLEVNMTLNEVFDIVNIEKCVLEADYINANIYHFKNYNCADEYGSALLFFKNNTLTGKISY